MHSIEAHNDRSRRLEPIEVRSFLADRIISAHAEASGRELHVCMRFMPTAIGVDLRAVAFEPRLDDDIYICARFCACLRRRAAQIDVAAHEIVCNVGGDRCAIVGDGRTVGWRP